ncbi:hypothetical protein ACFQX6_52680 [Streptosporangium lutulentum]
MIPVALACAFPVVVSVIALVAALCLRVGEYLLGDLAQRRSVRGSSATDPLLAVLGTPWALIKAVLATLVTAPLAAMFGMCVWGVLVYVGGMGVNDAARTWPPPTRRARSWPDCSSCPAGASRAGRCPAC